MGTHWVGGCRCISISGGIVGAGRCSCHNPQAAPCHDDSQGGSWGAPAPLAAAKAGRLALPSTAFSLECRSDTKWAAGRRTLSWAW